MTLSMGIGLQGLRRLPTATTPPIPPEGRRLKVEFDGPIHGFFLKAANGIIYKIQVATDGVLSIAPVS